MGGVGGNSVLASPVNGYRYHAAPAEKLCSSRTGIRLPHQKGSCIYIYIFIYLFIYLCIYLFIYFMDRVHVTSPQG